MITQSLPNQSQSPPIAYKSLRDMQKELLDTPFFRKMADPARPTPMKRNVEDRVTMHLDQLQQEVDWYSDVRNGDSYTFNKELAAFQIAKKGNSRRQSNLEDIYSTRMYPPACTCPDGPNCSHYYFIRELQG